MESPLKKEFEYYLAHQTELVEKYNGKFLVIKNEEVIGIYDDQVQAVTLSRKSHELGTFLVQKVEPGDAGLKITAIVSPPPLPTLRLPRRPLR